MQRGDVRRAFAEFNMFCICPAAAFKAAPGRFFKLRCRRLFQAALPPSFSSRAAALEKRRCLVFAFRSMPTAALRLRDIGAALRLLSVGAAMPIGEHLPPGTVLLSLLSYVLPKVHFFAFAAIYQRLQSGLGAFISKSPKKPRTSNPARSSSARSFFSV